MNKYIELSVETNPVWSECLSEILLNDIGCFGIVTNEIEYKDEVEVKNNSNIVKSYLWFKEPNRPNMDEIQQILLDKRLAIVKNGAKSEDIGSWEITTKDIKDEDWAHNWKKFWHVQKIGQKTVICPSWETHESQEGEIIIKLDPGSAFGTGSHATTRLCLVGIEKYMQQGFKVADIGSGSGILAISAALNGASEVVAVDNDPSVIDVAVENAKQNNVDKVCNFSTGSASDVEGKYDIVLVNILAEVIVSIFPDVIKLAKSGAKIILSGIIDLKEDYVLENAKELGLKILEVFREESDESQWICIVAEKNGTSILK